LRGNTEEESISDIGVAEKRDRVIATIFKGKKKGLGKSFLQTGVHGGDRGENG